MSTEEELNKIDELLGDLSREYNAQNEKEAAINAQIASLKLELTQIRDARNGIRYKIQQSVKQKESLERKIELEREAALIEKSLEAKRKEAEELLRNAPWRNDAFDWQIEGALSLPERAVLADKRGLGKTLSSLIWRRLQKSKKTLVCLRKEVSDDFIKEISTREPNLPIINMVALPSEQRKHLAFLLGMQEEYIVITNIESWRRSPEKVAKEILSIPFDAVILDEAHHIKNSKTGTALGFFEIAAKLPKVLELTGTPLKNKPQEMFSLFHALYPETFRKENDFLWDYCYQVTQNKWAFTPQGLAKLVNKISHFYLSRTPEDVGRKVPPPRIIEYKLDFEAHLLQKQAYKIMSERSLAMLTSGKALPIVSQLALMTRQAQMVSWPAGIVFIDPETEEPIRFDVEQSVKVDWAEDLIKELVEEGERILLFSRFKPALYELQRRLSDDVSVAVITGDERSSRKDIFDDFDLKTASKDNYRYNVLLATYQTVGESANLNAARHVILLDRFWNPGNEDQAIGRIDRINSIDQATVHIPGVEFTIDDYMAELIDDKRNLVVGFKSAADLQAKLIKNLQRSV